MRKFLAPILMLMLGAVIWSPDAKAADCYESSIVSPSPFLGNNDEVFKLADGSVWQVKLEYEYLYEYFPDVIICPSKGILALKGKTLDVVPIQRRDPAKQGPAPPPSGAITVVLRKPGCRYFLADGPRGIFLLQWFGGYDPAEGDLFVGDVGSFGFKDVIYTAAGSPGRVWVDDYMLGRSRAIEKFSEKCR